MENEEQDTVENIRDGLLLAVRNAKARADELHCPDARIEALRSLGVIEDEIREGYHAATCEIDRACQDGFYRRLARITEAERAADMEDGPWVA